MRLAEEAQRLHDLTDERIRKDGAVVKELNVQHRVEPGLRY